jgi:hypothetical protein
VHWAWRGSHEAVYQKLFIKELAWFMHSFLQQTAQRFNSLFLIVIIFAPNIHSSSPGKRAAQWLAATAQPA